MSRLRVEKLWLVVAMSIPGLYGLSLYSPMLSAKLGLIDDHEFITFLTVGGQSFAGIPTMLENSEIAKFGEFERFRPAYAFFRVLGSVIHGTDGFQWYLVRITMFLAVIVALSALVFLALQRSLAFSARSSAIIATCSGLFVAAMAAWSDIATRLGPSELFVAWGLVVTAWGLAFLYWQEKEVLGAILIALGFSLAVGSKENAISLIVPLIFALWLAVLRGSKLWLAVAAGAISAGATAYTAMGFLPPLLEDGQDVYGQSRSLGNALTAATQLWPFWIALLLLVVGSLLALKSSLPAMQRLLMATLSGSPLMLAISESYFYQYSISGGSFTPLRYGVLVEMSGILALVVLLVLGLKGNFGKPPLLKNISIGVALVVALLPLGQIANSLTYRDSAVANANYLNVQFEAIESTANYLKSEGVTQLLYVVDEPYDYERINATEKYFRYLSGVERSYFLWTDFSKVQMDQFTAPLAEELQLWSQEGNPDWNISPFSTLNKDSAVLCVHFGADPDPSPCSQSQWIGG